MVLHPGKLGQELTAGTWSQGLKQRPRRDTVYQLAFLVCFIQPRTPCPGVPPPAQGDDTAHSGLSPLTSIIKKSPYSCAYAPIWWEQFLTDSPSSQVTPVCVKLTNNSCAIPPFSWVLTSFSCDSSYRLDEGHTDDVILPSGLFKDAVSKVIFQGAGC